MMGIERRFIRGAASWLLLMAALAPPAAQAHGEAGDPLPPTPGVSVSAAVALRALNAQPRLGSTRMDGVLLRGDAGADPDGTQLEHGVLAAAWRIDTRWGAYAALGAHGSEPLVLEAAWLQWRHDDEQGAIWTVNAGRQATALGPVLMAEMHIGAYGLMPLAQRAAFDHHQGDDGLQAGWRHPVGGATLALDLGLWRGRSFPGSPSGGKHGPAWSLHAGANARAWSADAVWLQVRPRARAASTSPAVGHSHGSPRCDERFTEVICFAGRADLLGASLRWSGRDAEPRWPVTLTAAGWWRRDRGTLESANGLADYRGRSVGGWLDAEWHLRPEWSLGWRGEWLDAAHWLQGDGAQTLAREARLHYAQPGRRHALQVAWQVRPWARVALEGGEEQVAGQRAQFVALRLVLSQSWSVDGAP
jgi:hypothetical protein